MYYKKLQGTVCKFCTRLFCFSFRSVPALNIDPARGATAKRASVLHNRGICAGMPVDEIIGSVLRSSRAEEAFAARRL